MTIATVDGALAGMQPPVGWSKLSTNTLVPGRPFSLWSQAGFPGAGAFDTTLAGVALTSSSVIPAGALRHVDPGAGNSYLARLAGAASQPGMLMLCDRLWHNGGIGITTTTAQTVNSAAFPARDAAASINGDTVLIGLEVSANCGAAAPAPTISYTNQAGTAGKSAGLAFATAASPQAGSFFQFGLQAGDTGVKSVQTYTQGTSWVSGTVNLVAYRILAALPLPGANIPNDLDLLTGGFPRLPNGVVPFLLFVPTAAGNLNLSGTYAESQG
jgi:hypothetical protein